MVKQLPQTFGLLSEKTPFQNYTVTIYRYRNRNVGNGGYDTIRSVKAMSIDNLRKALIAEFKGDEVSIEVERRTARKNRFVGTLEIDTIPGAFPKWQIAGKNAWSKVDPQTGALI